jgi:hypothetical protein
MTTSLGIDPDVHKCAFAYLNMDGKLQVRVVRQKELKGRDAAVALIQQQAFKFAVECFHPDILVVEGQDVRYTGKTSFANPQDVCNLALITGAALALSYAPKKYSPLPREWKGTVPKGIKQCRILSALGIKYEMKGGKDPYPVPVDFEQYCIGKVNASDWKDLTDAVGLAAWGLGKRKEPIKWHG